VRSTSAIDSVYISHAEAIDTLTANFYLCGSEEKHGGTKEDKGSTMIQEM